VSPHSVSATIASISSSSKRTPVVALHQLEFLANRSEIVSTHVRNVIATLPLLRVVESYGYTQAADKHDA